MLDHLEFTTKSKSMLIAPAGFGKTHTIAECIEYTQGRQLILTHTHAGIIAIKEKIKQSANSNYNVETITSFAQKYVLAFYTGNDIPEQKDAKKYYPFIINKATELLKINSIIDIVKNTYSGLFVDEYQDCTVTQHNLILVLSEVLPTHIFGDYLQGIFNFDKNNPLVNLQSATDMMEFLDNSYELIKPYRWIKGGNETLGNNLKEIRTKLECRQPIDFRQYAQIELYMSDDIYRDSYTKLFEIITSSDSLLIIDPESSHIGSRIKFIQMFKNIPRLIESIDNKEFYDIANLIEGDSRNNYGELVYNILASDNIVSKTELQKWLKITGLVNKRNEAEKLLMQPINENFIKLKKHFSAVKLSSILRQIISLPGIRCYRKELMFSICKALEDSENKNISISDAMVNQRNSVRRAGRKIYGICIGTTLLTKGLEFDTVIVINAHQFACPKHLYVALTRASKRLVVYTKKAVLEF